jgi:hypothetical protein
MTEEPENRGPREVATFAPGDAVEVLIHWAYGSPPHWFGGFEVVADEGRRVRVRDSRDGVTGGSVLLYARWIVRLRVFGPRVAETWERSGYEENSRKTA